jgi:hypothetical protein
MSFIRPEIRAAAFRWREALIGLLCVLLGLWWLFFARGILVYVGAVVVLAGLALVWIGAQRSRFRGPGDATGAVEVLEGQITYFGPETGGMVAVAELARVILDPSGAEPIWRLEQPGLPPLDVPVNARGADQLFDAFSMLPGLKVERMLAEMKRDTRMAVVIWESPDAAERPLRLN